MALLTFIHLKYLFILNIFIIFKVTLPMGNSIGVELSGIKFSSALTCLCHVIALSRNILICKMEIIEL